MKFQFHEKFKFSFQNADFDGVKRGFCQKIPIKTDKKPEIFEIFTLNRDFCIMQFFFNRIHSP